MIETRGVGSLAVGLALCSIVGVSASFAGQDPQCGGVPIPALPVVDVTDSVEPLGVYDQADIDDALARCRPGCNLRFLPQIYRDVAMDIGAFPDGFAMFGAGQGSTILRAPIYGVSGAWDYMVDLGSDVPDGFVIQDMTLDGRKNEQTPPPAADCADAFFLIRATYAIHAGTTATAIREGGAIQCLEIKNFLMIGVLLAHATGYRVRDNWIHDMGCHDFTQPCGPAWSAWHCVVPSGLPHRRTNGYGVFLTNFADGNEISNNVIEDLSKFALVVEALGPAGGCHVPGYPKDNVLRNNVIRRGSDGIAVNGACRTIIEDNLVEGSVATMNENTPIGIGYECVRAGCEGTEMRRNIARNNQSTGFMVSGNGPVLLEDNISENNCLGTQNSLGDIEIDGTSGVRVDVTVSDHQATGPTNCFAGIHIVGWAGATVSGGAIHGGRFGIRVNGSQAVRVEGIEVQAGAGAESGVSFGPGLDRVYVQDTAQFPGFPEEEHFDEGSLDDGNSVAYCAKEFVGPDPQCCLNLAGYDPMCDSLPACGPVPDGAPAVLSLHGSEPGDPNTLLSWTPLPLAEVYDVVRGDLPALAASAGDFGVSTEQCLSDDRFATSFVATGDPPSGQGFWFLVRAVYCGGAGSYDSGHASQPQSRNAGIADSGSGCP